MSRDMNSKWNLIRYLVIVGSVLGGLVIVVIVAYIIGRRKHSNDYESAN